METLRVMWERKDRVSDIAAALGISHSAVAGKARTMCLTPRKAETWGRKPPKGFHTKWELRPLPPDIELDPHEQRYANWLRARDAARAALRATIPAINSGSSYVGRNGLVFSETPQNNGFGG
jgi:hypothetical protein